MAKNTKVERSNSAHMRRSSILDREALHYRGKKECFNKQLVAAYHRSVVEAQSRENRLLTKDEKKYVYKRQMASQLLRSISVFF